MERERETRKREGQKKTKLISFLMCWRLSFFVDMFAYVRTVCRRDISGSRLPIYLKANWLHHLFWCVFLFLWSATGDKICYLKCRWDRYFFYLFALRWILSGCFIVVVNIFVDDDDDDDYSTDITDPPWVDNKNKDVDERKMSSHRSIDMAW